MQSTKIITVSTQLLDIFEKRTEIKKIIILIWFTLLVILISSLLLVVENMMLSLKACVGLVCSLRFESNPLTGLLRGDKTSVCNLF